MCLPRSSQRRVFLYRAMLLRCNQADTTRFPIECLRNPRSPRLVIPLPDPHGVGLNHLRGAQPSRTSLTLPPQRKAAVKAEKATRGGKAKKDPKAPKRAMSAYMFFSQDWRERIKTENPDAGFGESMLWPS